MPQTAEILFEVYDGSAPEEVGTSGDAETGASKFLGLGLVGIDELVAGSVISQVLTLQPRPYDTEAVQGSIVVDFIFIENAELTMEQRSLAMRMQELMGAPDSMNITPTSIPSSSSFQKVSKSIQMFNQLQSNNEFNFDINFSIKIILNYY